MSRDTEKLDKTAVAHPTTPTQRTRGVLTVTAGDDVGRVVSVGDREMVVTLGRADECTVRFRDASLSRVHAQVLRVADDFLIKDMESTNGSFVNDERVDYAAQLRDGDRIRLGSSTALRFALVDEAEEQAMKRMFEASRRENLLSALQTVEDKGDGLREDLMQAREFQLRALSEPPRLRSVRVEIVYRPLDLVGGDLYHLSSGGDYRLRVFVADSTGHGIKASLTTMLILGEYEAIKRSAPGPAQVLSELNDRIVATYAHLGLRFTAACLDLDFAGAELRHASAAHPAPCLLRGGQPFELESGGTFMGLVLGATFPEWRLPLSPGDAVLTFTDGAVEQLGPSGEEFGADRLCRAVLRALEGKIGIDDAVRTELSTFAGAGKPLDDDVTVIAVSWTPR